MIRWYSNWEQLLIRLNTTKLQYFVIQHKVFLKVQSPVGYVASCIDAVRNRLTTSIQENVTNWSKQWNMHCINCIPYLAMYAIYIMRYGRFRWDFLLETTQNISNYWLVIQGIASCKNMEAAYGVLHYEGAEAINISSMGQPPRIKDLSLRVSESQLTSFFNK